MAGAPQFAARELRRAHSSPAPPMILPGAGFGRILTNGGGRVKGMGPDSTFRLALSHRCWDQASAMAAIRRMTPLKGRNFQPGINPVLRGEARTSDASSKPS